MSISEIISGESYDDLAIEELIQTNGNIESSSFYECRFTHCSFSETKIYSCRFVECTFDDCDFSLAQITSSVFSGIHFVSSRLLGMDWTKADWNSSTLGKPLSFSGCNISHSTFIGLTLPGSKILGSICQNVDFREADFSGTDFDGTDLTDSLFINTNLSKADLSGAKNYTIAPDKNTLHGAKFALPEAMSLLFSLNIRLVDDKS